ncbi:MAG: LemA family protein [Bacilli bacterium]
MFWYILIIIIVILAIFGIIYISIYNKFQFTIIKLTEAENIIKKSLKTRLSLFDRIIPIIKDRIKNDDDNKLLDSMIKIKNKKFNNIELNNEVEKCNKNLNEVLDSNLDLYKDESIINILKEFSENKEDIEYGEKYYNDNVVYYNKLIRSFPSNIVGLTLGYKHKEFYENETEEMYEILKK